MSLVPCATPTAEDRYTRLAIHLRNVQRYLPENEKLVIAAAFTEAVSYDQIQERLRIKLAVILTPELLHENTALLYMTQVLLRHFPDLMDKDIEFSLRGSEPVRVHGLLFKAQSPVFVAAFSNYQEALLNRYTLSANVSENVFKRFLDLVETGKAKHIDCETVQELYMLADMYLLPKVKTLCQKFLTGVLENTPSAANFLDIWIFADEMNDHELERVCGSICYEKSFEMGSVQATLEVLERACIHRIFRMMSVCQDALESLLKSSVDAADFLSVISFTAQGHDPEMQKYCLDLCKRKNASIEEWDATVQGSVKTIVELLEIATLREFSIVKLRCTRSLSNALSMTEDAVDFLAVLAYADKTHDLHLREMCFINSLNKPARLRNELPFPNIDPDLQQRCLGLYENKHEGIETVLKLLEVATRYQFPKLKDKCHEVLKRALNASVDATDFLAVLAFADRMHDLDLKEICLKCSLKKPDSLLVQLPFPNLVKYRRGIEDNSTLTLNMRCFDAEGLIEILSSYPIQTLSISCAWDEPDHRTEPKIAAIAKALKENKSLKTLYLEGHSFSSGSGVKLAAALQVNTTLLELNLNIKPEGARAIARALEDNKTLERLDLSHNRIGDEGAIAFAEALKKNKSLKKLGLSHNKIGDPGVKALAKSLLENTTLETLFLGNNKIQQAGTKELIDPRIKK
jgi:hypothetical protein